ncbi:MAG: hypothetical protein Lokiarch_28870 [Candidatus Lokiarchaeum sp. GC14_75]|nr:MAG: hypothetical protein Lokiarch_28870 [Candidatus Lokiarchaeum sp. GC14_75]
MVDDKVDIEDLEAFIDGLKTSLDTLGDIDPQQSKGFQAQLAKAISDLRLKRKAKIEPLPKRIGHLTNEDLKIILLKELESLQDHLDTSDYNRRKKFEVVMKITRIREQINSM